ncbi:MAG: alpha-galactosidase, partial [Clostridiales bacterium]|nr:alpha-galactosidase [Clostridiales bacterium]
MVIKMNLKNRRYRIIYNANGKVFNTDKPQTEHFSLNITEDEKTYNVSVVPKTDVEFVKFSVDFPREYNSSEKMFVNGYQSWTDSFEYSAGERMHELTRLTEFIIKKSPFKSLGFSKSGDILFTDYPREKNIFYGWSYGYIRSGSTVEIFGSLSERSGYTRIEFNVKNNLVSVSKDLCGVVYKKETPLLSLAVIKGEYDSAFDEYFDKMGIKCRENKRRMGYTTWYNYYGGITEQIVNRDLAGIAESDIRFDCFQIDDGYQQAIGDWLKVNKSKFPNGMKKIAADIHGKNMIAGLWLAPFAAVRSSELYKNHQDWIIKDKFGKPYKTGPNWGGFYSLDIYNPQVREYLKNVFFTVLNDWGFDLVKLDFLYGACVLPMHNKTRGEIMCDAMDLLRELCGDKLILGCGVPLMPAFGKVDYCRIGADIDLKWKRSRYCIREDVSTPHAVCNSIFRRSLNSRAWMNDPDVFLLRDNNIK